MPRINSRTYTDYSNEKSVVGINIDPATTDLDLGTLTTAMDALVLGLAARNDDTEYFRFSNAVPTNPLAKRERKLLIRYEDTTSFRVFTFAIPSYDDSALTPISGTDFYDITAGALATFVTAFEAVAVSPDGGACNVLSAEGVGRNL